MFSRKSTKHYAIYECGPDGAKRSMYRHFIALDDGSIIEIFEQFTISSSIPAAVAAAVNFGDASAETGAGSPKANLIENILSKDLKSAADAENGSFLKPNSSSKFRIFAGLENV